MTAHFNMLIVSLKIIKRRLHISSWVCLFKNQLINTEKIEIPAVEGDMGGLKVLHVFHRAWNFIKNGVCFASYKG